MAILLHPTSDFWFFDQGCTQHFYGHEVFSFLCDFFNARSAGDKFLTTRALEMALHASY